MDTSISSRLAALKAPTGTFPLEALLRIYAKYKERNPLYLNYFEGFKLLVDWLEPLEVPQLTAQELLPIPPCFHTYEIQEIAAILHLDQALIYTIFWRIHYEPKRIS